MLYFLTLRCSWWTIWRVCYTCARYFYSMSSSWRKKTFCCESCGLIKHQPDPSLEIDLFNGECQKANWSHTKEKPALARQRIHFIPLTILLNSPGIPATALMTTYFYFFFCIDLYSFPGVTTVPSDMAITVALHPYLLFLSFVLPTPRWTWSPQTWRQTRLFFVSLNALLCAVPNRKGYVGAFREQKSGLLKEWTLCCGARRSSFAPTKTSPLG